MFKTRTQIFQEIFPGQFEPSKCHKFIRLIEDHGKLLRNYTQNIDTLEQVAGITRVIQCHGKSKTGDLLPLLSLGMIIGLDF